MTRRLPRRLSLSGLADRRAGAHRSPTCSGASASDLIKAGVHGLTPLGSTGEFAYLSREQREAVVRATIEAAGKARAGDRRRRLDGDRRRGRAGQALSDSSAPTASSPFSKRISRSRTRRSKSYFRAIADGVDIPVVLYTNPQFQRSDLTLDVIARLAEHPRIQYIKDASTNTGRLLSIMNRCPEHESVFGVGAYSGGGDADRRRRLDGGTGLHRAAPEREALRFVPRREMAARR